GEGPNVEGQRLAHMWRSMVGIEFRRLVKRPGVVPDGIHPRMIEADKILRAHDEAGAHAVVVVAHLVVAVFDVKPSRAHRKFRRAHEIRSASDQVRIFTRYPERHEAAHRKSRSGAMLTIGDRAV